MYNTQPIKHGAVCALTILSIATISLTMSGCPAPGPGGGGYGHTDYNLSNSYLPEDGDTALGERPFVHVDYDSTSTFAVDVDTAGYTVIRRDLLQQQVLPVPDEVRIEEMINYFSYDYPLPAEPGVPFAVYTEVAECPWTPGNKLLHIGLKGANPAEEERPPSNIVFLIDVSGSMDDSNKLPLVKQSMHLFLASYLTSDDTLSIVTYSNVINVPLQPVLCSPGNKMQIRSAIDALHASGRTNGSGGIQRAYEVASAEFIEGGINRVILCTDGDFNLGLTSTEALENFIADKARSGVFLTVLGFGLFSEGGEIMETLADKGNGNYGYIDTLAEAFKLLVNELTATMITIAKDVKIQVEFNPAEVTRHRLIGYENRELEDDDFYDDRVDAGDIGAGHTVTAIYELMMADEAKTEGEGGKLADATASKQDTIVWEDRQLCLVSLNYKEPDSNISEFIKQPVSDSDASFESASEDFRFSASVAAFGMLLRDSLYSGNANFYSVGQMAQSASSDDPFEYKDEFVYLVERAQLLSRNY